MIMRTIPPAPKRIPFTPEGYQKLLDEKKQLVSERPDAVKNLSEARNMGDLSENGYYHAAKARLRGMDSRIRHLERLIKFGKVISGSTSGVVGFGSTVIIADSTAQYRYTIVGGYESDPVKHTISHLSPIGKALLGRKNGDVVSVQAPNGLKQYTIVSVV